MTVIRILFCLFAISSAGFSQSNFPHIEAHAHNDYEHVKPLWNALENGFISVEADVHLVDGKLLVSHGKPQRRALTLQQLYLTPLDSLLIHNNNKIYPDYNGSFYLMVDCKTDAESTYEAIQNAVGHYTKLICNAVPCPVKIYISGNRAIGTMIKNGYQGIAFDGRPDDLGKEIPVELMPVVSDHYSNWSSWKGKTEVRPEDLIRVRDLAQRVHAEGKKLRLWAIPDNELAWAALINAGVDFINSDRLAELHNFLQRRGQ